MVRHALIALAAGAAIAAPASIAAPSAERGIGATVKVVDFEFRDDDVRVSSGQRIKFRWSPKNASPHNVTLREGPDGVRMKDFTSITGTTSVRFEPRFAERGEYMFRCTIHPDLMRLDVSVGR